VERESLLIKENAPLRNLFSLSGWAEMLNQVNWVTKQFHRLLNQRNYFLAEAEHTEEQQAQETRSRTRCSKEMSLSNSNSYILPYAEIEQSWDWEWMEGEWKYSRKQARGGRSRKTGLVISGSHYHPDFRKENGNGTHPKIKLLTKWSMRGW